MMDKASYQAWRRVKLENYPQNAEELLVEIGGLTDLNGAEKAAILTNCWRSNMAIYQCRDDSVDRASVRGFAANFGLLRLDHHLCANSDGVSELSVATRGIRTEYVPYSNRSLSWHTDGYYNDRSHQVRSVVLHCANSAESGGENTLLDPDIAYIRLRDENPAFITALEHPECMTIPANTGAEGEIRPAVTGPVFSRDPGSGAIHMRYSARRKNIQWRDDKVTRAAREFLTEFLADENGPVIRYRLQAGEGLISNNVLHNRTAFDDGPGCRRLLYRARFHDRLDCGARLTARQDWKHWKPG
jgi:alpha-ketoglutarate-dependent taurine dioxygenase